FSRTTRRERNWLQSQPGRSRVRLDRVSVVLCAGWDAALEQRSTRHTGIVDLDNLVARQNDRLRGSSRIEQYWTGSPDRPRKDTRNLDNQAHLGLVAQDEHRGLLSLDGGQRQAEQYQPDAGECLQMLCSTEHTTPQRMLRSLSIRPGRTQVERRVALAR